MTTSKPSTAAERIDDLMERASTELVERRYFDAERNALEALELAHRTGDFERMARILLPLQECRRQKRDLAADAGGRFRVVDALPKPADLEPGLYLVEPPRVGLDGRMLREQADRQGVPVIVVTREPPTRDGKWPIVSLGPVVVRTRIDPPPTKTPARRKTPTSRSTKSVSPAAPALPPISWFLAAGESLGDQAIADAEEKARSPIALLEELYLRLAAVPDHEKLHQRLADVCRQAATKGLVRAKPLQHPGDDELDPDEGGD
ncbi:MAG: hypothetical protein KIT68_11025 [Phycisphaeraceae bacterium]|nr:hypothetical protein [Phycisphaeraceae bacterium]